MSGVDFQNISFGLQLQRGAANEGSWGTASPKTFSWLLAQLKSSGLKQMSAPRAVTISGREVEMSIGNGTNEINFCVNLMDAAESDTRPRDDLPFGKYGNVTTATVKRANMELWRWIAAAGLLVLMFEWWWYHKRTA